MNPNLDKLDVSALMNTPHECVAFTMRKASRAISQIYEEALHSTGLRGTQYSLLVATAFIGDQGIGALAEGLVTNRTTITRNLKPLIARGLIRNAPGPDRRTRGLELTDEGVETIREAYPLWRAAQERVLKELGQERFDVVKSFADDAVKLAYAK